MRRVARTAAAAVCTLSVLTLAACGSEGGDSAAEAKKGGAASSAAPATEPFADMSGPDVVSAAFKNIHKATSLSLSVDMRSTDTPMKAQFSTSVDGGKCTGTTDLGADGSMSIIKIGETVYMKLDETMLRAQSEGESEADIQATVDTVADHWMAEKASDPDTKDMVEFCDLTSLLSAFEEGDTEAKKAGTTTLDGTPALRLTEKDGEETYTILVSTEGDPQLLQVVTTGGDEPMTMTFSDVDKPVVAEKPAAEDMVDLG
ncbi:hypothetical protein [Streptomyces sp. NBC_00102]|uniref:hypothetical protein n=1 Tax=Streptomyces sp. NBC_00102 TaxID=2975652 RepID=UPI0022554274|nr:hypothetical protein [Streptomyces sp. NBC_00102]MCX5399152.1 hypothetical protein [Streptomyces sp. NBC_00102]